VSIIRYITTLINERNINVRIKNDGREIIMQLKPYWFDEWVIITEEGWKLKEGAPEEVKKAFEEYMKVR